MDYLSIDFENQNKNIAPFCGCNGCTGCKGCNNACSDSCFGNCKGCSTGCDGVCKGCANMVKL